MILFIRFYLTYEELKLVAAIQIKMEEDRFYLTYEELKHESIRNGQSAADGFYLTYEELKLGIIFRKFNRYSDFILPMRN